MTAIVFDFPALSARLRELEGDGWWQPASARTGPSDVQCSTCTDLGWITTKRVCPVCANRGERSAPRVMP